MDPRSRSGSDSDSDRGAPTLSVIMGESKSFFLQRFGHCSHLQLLRLYPDLLVWLFVCLFPLPTSLRCLFQGSQASHWHSVPP